MFTGVALEKRTLHSGIFFSVEFSFHLRCPPSGAKKWQNMAVTRASHSCFLIELGPICNSMEASLWLKNCEDHSLLKSYNGGLWKNNYRSGPKRRISGLLCWIPWPLCMWPVICFWCIILISASPIMISAFKKSTFLKQKSSRLQKRALLVGRVDGWLSFALHIGLEAYEMHFCTMNYSVSILSFIRNSLVPKSEHLCFLIVMLEHFWSMCSCDCQNMV